MFETLIDHDAAEIAAAEAAIEPIAAEMTLYARALNTLTSRISAIQAEAAPIEDAHARLGWKRNAAQARADLARYRALAPESAGRERHFERARSEALRAYRQAQSTYVASDKGVVETTFNAVLHPLQTMWARIGHPAGPDGIVVTAELVYATFYPRLIALKERMVALAGGKPH